MNDDQTIIETPVRWCLLEARLRWGKGAAPITLAARNNATNKVPCTNRAACATFYMWQVRRAEGRGVVCHTKDGEGMQTKVPLWKET